MDDKLMILKMLEEGKITADEACRLLEAIEGGTKTDYKQNQTNTRQPFNFEEDFAKKIENTAKDIAGATKRFTEKLFDNINTTFSTAESRFTIMEKRTFPLDCAASSFDIVIRTTGFGVNIIPCFNNDITVEIEGKSLQGTINVDDCIRFHRLTNSYELLLDFPEKTWGRLDIQIPHRLLKLIVETQNAKCCITDLICTEIKALSSNAKIELVHCKAEKVDLTTDNAKIVISDSKIADAILKTNNGRIEFIDSYINQIVAETCNAPIYLNDITTGQDGENTYRLYTTNSKIDVVVNAASQCAYAIDAHTSFGEIIVKLDDLSSTEEKMPNYASRLTAESMNYANADKKLLISAKTSNAPINISK